MNAIDSKRICEGYVPIPGYTLEERIGRGGFGEVWRADAPGGLKKAVKFVFGTQDQSRASRELRSLERIKGVHHPFLLTLERFEIVDDQLVIVTELADGSLEDVFKRHRERGSCGIPRDVLISHLHDAADALDYLHQCYQLQHLDIKPGNLLMVGGHVKVADFGLLKDLTEAECSLVGGLTPIYAPPEVFDGRPSMHSDQYSLAVMYQEMLTGTRPFSGRTIAQLATQHVHSAPNLEPLPPGDRPVTARALEKNPTRRFPNCKAFVETLYNPRRASVAVATDIQESEKSPEHEVADLPQLAGNNSTGSRGKQHSLVIGLGGTGAESLRELRARVVELHSACALDLHGVLIDTDMGTVHSMRVAEASDRVPACRTIHIPLRTAHEYRQKGTEHLASVSRRWIYNVPRSRSTEGMRPLGRLALVDHGEAVLAGLRDAISKLKEAAGQQAKKVYVIGSLSGGTGSGIYVDVVHVLRSLLDEAGMEATQILSVLSTSELRADPATPLALHDTQAALIEMEHFMKAGNGYPGDEGAGFPSVPAARTPLHNVYLIAATPRSVPAPSPIRTICDYVWADTTGGSEVLEAARADHEENDNNSVLKSPSIRSVGIVPLGISRRLEQRLLVPATVRHLLIRWLGLPSRAREIAVSLSARLLRRCAISREAFLDATCEVICGDEQIRDDILAEQLGELTEEQRDCESTVRETLAGILRESVCGETDLMVESVMSNLTRELSVYLHDQRIDVTTAIETLKVILESIRGLVVTETESQDNTAESSLAEDDVEFESPEDEVIPEAPIPVEIQAFESAARQVTDERLEQLATRLAVLQARLETFATNLALAIVQATKDQPTDSNPWEEMPEPIREHFEPTVLKLHELTVSRWLLRPLVEASVTDENARDMVDDLWHETMPLVSEVVERKDCDYNAPIDATQSLSSTSLTGTIRLPREYSGGDSTFATQPLSPQANADDSGLEPAPLPVAEAIEAVRPPMLDCGGQQRLILMVGTDKERERFELLVRESKPEGLSVALVPDATPKLIHEAQQIKLKNVLRQLNKLNGNAQVTQRLVTRTDVNWQTS